MIKFKLLSSTSYGTVCYAVQGGVPTFKSVDKILNYDHSNESY